MSRPRARLGRVLAPYLLVLPTTLLILAFTWALQLNTALAQVGEEPIDWCIPDL